MTASPLFVLRDRLPARISRLAELAYNLWWTWHPEAQDLFAALDRSGWDNLLHNPIPLLWNADTTIVTRLSADATYVALYEQVLDAFDAYMAGRADTWFQRQFPGDDNTIAYFCMEYGLHESLPIYSGGLGILAGDHCKAASDLGLPLVAVGLWYPEGYFRQRISTEGAQVALPESMRVENEPLLPAHTDGRELVLTLPFADRSLSVRVWRLQIGRVPLFLLDTDLDANSPQDRSLCDHLYGGDRETRIAQEYLLGVGGVRALRALGIQPRRWHMNEGHAAFMGLERIRELVQQGIPFTYAWPQAAEDTVFTTHTPVPAGNEVFRTDLVQKYFASFPAQMQVDEEGFLQLGNEEGAAPDTFAMTPMALRLSHRANGVSVLHGAVARTMWAKQFSSVTQVAVPIGSITNGVHAPTWMAPALRALLDAYLSPGWLAQVDDPAVWRDLARVPDSELWRVHQILKAQLLAFARDRAAASRSGAELNPEALTIGFARRFATYKRATLFFHDLERATAIVRNSARPVQLLFAGKAHPADSGGQALIKAIFDYAASTDLAGHVVFVDGYDMNVARYLVQGVDLWLNNPERPQEASGTSGQKAAMNGVPNCSVRDGWWDEAYNGQNGWSFGGEVGEVERDSRELYDVLEHEVIPTYYAQDGSGMPAGWVQRMKATIASCAPTFSAERMVKEYTRRMYR